MPIKVPAIDFILFKNVLFVVANVLLLQNLVPRKFFLKLGVKSFGFFCLVL